MGFTVIKKSRENGRAATSSRVLISRHAKNTFVTVSGDVAAKLGWAKGTKIDILEGHGEDAGWLALHKSETGRALHPSNPKGRQLKVACRHLLTHSDKVPVTACKYHITDGILYVAIPARLLPVNKRESDPGFRAPILNAMVAAE